jgi:tRNA (mo5U34)-methyltransferase
MGKTLQTNFENPTGLVELEIARLGPWFHNLHLPGGTQTAPGHPLGDFPRFKWNQIEPHLPDVSNWRVLDIGCNAGFYSFALARRGARVTAIDLDPHYLTQATWAAKRFGLQDRVEFRQMQVYDLAHETEEFDLVWFMGVLYHLRYPLLALDILTRKARQMLLLQTLTQPGEEAISPPEDLALDKRSKMAEPGWPTMAFIEHRLAGDPTNWWAPNHACIEAMLRSCGFEVAARPGHEIYLAKPASPASPRDELVEAQYRAATGQNVGREPA